MAKRNTKQIILDKALELFSTKGYDGVTVADIADAVGIKAASLYKHYESKQDIFDSILKRAADNFRQHTEQLGIDGHDYKNDVQKYEDMSLDTLINIGTSLFLYALHDEAGVMLRRLFTIEQYRNAEVSKLFTEQYINAPLAYQTALFKTFTERGIMKIYDADIAAAHFYSPIYLMLCLCDNCSEREQEALDLIRRHITQFNKLYMIGEEA